MMKYTCPMHREIEQSLPGLCSKCKMSLVVKGSDSLATVENDYTPLVVIIGVIAVTIAVLGYNSSVSSMFSWHQVMMQFMAASFIVFAGFKLMDLKGFAKGYTTYDLIAKRVYAYGYIYPFIELGLGLLYLSGLNTFELNLFTFVLMTINGTGVLIKLAKKEAFQCACLGTFLKVPLTKFSLAEDFGMALMALLMLVL